MVIYDDEILEKYEQSQEWEKCIKYLKSLINSTRFLQVNLRMFIECWYVLANWDCFIFQEKNRKEVFCYFLENAYNEILKAPNNSFVKTVVGYCISATPLVFTFLDENYIQLEKYGKKLIQSEVESNCFAKFLFQFDNKQKINDDLLNQNKKLFQGNSESINYFYELVNDYEKFY